MIKKKFQKIEENKKKYKGLGSKILPFSLTHNLQSSKKHVSQTIIFKYKNTSL
jgi:hypothetical protein